MEQCNAQLRADKPDATAHEQEVIEIITRMKGCALLCWQAVHTDGLLTKVDGEVKIHAVSEELRKFCKLELDALRLLSPDRRAKMVGTSSLAALLSNKEASD
jgi:hypothetical protein